MKTAIGHDPGLATFGQSCVSEDGGAYSLDTVEVFGSENEEDVPFATNVAKRTRELSLWLLRRFAEIERLYDRGYHRFAVAAERYEFLRSSVSAAELAAGHAALVSTFGQRGGYWYETSILGLPDYPSAKEVKRAVTGCPVASKRVVECAVRRIVRGAEDRLDEMLKGDREHAADSIAVALHALGCRVPPIVMCGHEDLQVVANLGVYSTMSASDLRSGQTIIQIGDLFGKNKSERALLDWIEVDRSFMYAHVPSPSHDREWWKVKKNAEKARRFLATALKEPT